MLCYTSEYIYIYIYMHIRRPTGLPRRAGIYERKQSTLSPPKVRLNVASFRILLLSITTMNYIYIYIY